jgi:hypothetical protein
MMMPAEQADEGGALEQPDPEPCAA